MAADLIPITPITLETQDRRKWAFRPQSDMTALESALLAQLFAQMIMTVWHGSKNWPAYVSEHKLDRHFVELRKTDREGFDENMGSGPQRNGRWREGASVVEQIETTQELAARHLNEMFDELQKTGAPVKGSDDGAA